LNNSMPDKITPGFNSITTAEEALKSLPLALKAYRAQRFFFNTLEGKPDTSFGTQVARIAALAARHLDRPAAEIEGVIVIAILMMSPSIARRDRLADEYSPQVAEAFVRKKDMEEDVKQSRDLQEALMLIIANVGEDVMERRTGISARGIGELRKLRRDMTLISQPLARYLDTLAERLETLLPQRKAAPGGNFQP